MEVGRWKMEVGCWNLEEDINWKQLGKLVIRMTTKICTMIKSYKDLDVYKLSYELAMDIFFMTKKFPKEEIYSLASQVIRLSRSINANIAEGWAKRTHENLFKLHLVTALGSCSETENWISFAKDCKYIDGNDYEIFIQKIESVGKMLTKLHQKWKTF